MNIWKLNVFKEHKKKEIIESQKVEKKIIKNDIEN